MLNRLEERFEMAYDSAFKTVTFTCLLPNLNDLQYSNQDLFNQSDYDDIINNILTEWQDKKFLNYLIDANTNKNFYNIMLKQKDKGRIKDIKVMNEGKRKRMTCWYRPPEWFKHLVKDDKQIILGR